MSSYFYIDRNYQQQGPVEANELPKYGVTQNTKVWKQGMMDWQIAGSISELRGIFPPEIAPPPPPPPPPVAPQPYQPNPSYPPYPSYQTAPSYRVSTLLGFYGTIKMYAMQKS